MPFWVWRSSGSATSRPCKKILFSKLGSPLLVLADDHGAHDPFGDLQHAVQLSGERGGG